MKLTTHSHTNTHTNNTTNNNNNNHTRNRSCASTTGRACRAEPCRSVLCRADPCFAEPNCAGLCCAASRSRVLSNSGGNSFESCGIVLCCGQWGSIADRGETPSAFEVGNWPRCSILSYMTAVFSDNRDSWSFWDSVFRRLGADSP